MYTHPCRFALQGMGSLGSQLDQFQISLPESSGNLSVMKRFSISDGLIKSLLRGVRMCL